MRLAPVQVACLGHPVSGRRNQIDYFISGKDIETTQANYSENLILVPGSGVLPYLPEYQRKHPKPTVGRVAVPWSAIKYNMPMFKCLKELQEAGAHLVFIPGSSIHRYQASIPVRMSMLEYFGRDITIVPNLPYSNYMEVLETCQFAVDSYPFGGYNTIVESLWCGLPIVTLEGNKWFNQVASYLLRRVGLEELVTSSLTQYTEVAKSLIFDTIKLDSIRQQVSKVDFKHLIGSDKTEDFITVISKLTGAKNE
jgi:predicted O-linked N-acetylglucosamine transferase (SPINDLY family)